MPTPEEIAQSQKDLAGFWECGPCAAKTGTPVLCKSCLHNRELIRRLTGQADLVPHLKDLADSYRAAAFKASWERMCLLAAIASAQVWTDDYYFPASLDKLVDSGPYRQEVRAAQQREVEQDGIMMPLWLRMELGFDGA